LSQPRKQKRLPALVLLRKIVWEPKRSSVVQHNNVPAPGERSKICWAQQRCPLQFGLSREDGLFPQVTEPMREGLSRIGNRIVARVELWKSPAEFFCPPLYPTGLGPSGCPAIDHYVINHDSEATSAPDPPFALPVIARM
jgi:hypothetical protein